jgi:hypothetical protein
MAMKNPRSIQMSHLCKIFFFDNRDVRSALELSEQTKMQIVEDWESSSVVSSRSEH